MLVIRDEHIEAFRHRSLSSFEAEMIPHFFDFSPKHCEVIGVEGVREVIRLGMAKARNFDFTNRGPVCLYIEMMFIFGGGFDSDPQFPWAAEILGRRDIADIDRADRLYDKTMDYLAKVAGPDRGYAIKAAHDIYRFAKEPLLLSADTFVGDMLKKMHGIYPQKCTYVGDDALLELIRECKREASLRQVSSVRGTALLVALMFAVGHGCTHDPLFPWIARTLNDTKIVDTPNRIKRLEDKTLTYLHSALNQTGRA